MERKIFIITGGSKEAREARADRITEGLRVLRAPWNEVASGSSFALSGLRDLPDALLLENVVGVKHHLNLVKSLSTERRISIELKGRDPITVPLPQLTIFLVEDLPQFLLDSRHFEVIDLGKPVSPAEALAEQLACVSEIIKSISALGKLFKRKEKKQPRRLYIPEEHVREVLEVYDQMRPGKTVSCYDFWELIVKLCPEAGRKGTYWSFTYAEDKLRPYLEEKFDK